jgi:hypothetical protein
MRIAECGMKNECRCPVKEPGAAFYEPREAADDAYVGLAINYYVSGLGLSTGAAQRGRRAL